MTPLPENVPLDLVVESQDSMASMFIHALLTFDGHLDTSRLEHSLQLLAKRVPILSCELITKGATKWKWAAADELDEMFQFETFDTAPDAQAAIQKLVAADPPSNKPPLLRALLARAPDRDRLGLKFSHVISDAGGVKELVYLLAETYRELGRDPDWNPGPARLGSRGMRQIMSKLGLRDWSRLLKTSLREDRAAFAPGSVIHFMPEDRGQPAYVDVFLDKDLVMALRSYGHAHGAKLNDLLIAGFVRAQLRLGGNGDRCVVPFTVDLRRYIDDQQVIVSNVSSITFIAVPCSALNTFDEALAYICSETSFYKSHFIGLSGTMRVLIISGLVPASLRRKLLRWVWRVVSDRGLVGPGFTNLGVIDQHKSDFGDVDLAQISVGAPVSRAGRLICSASGFANTITIHLGCQDGGNPDGLAARLGRCWREELEQSVA
jgi:NRPS condensation-like uncharacterized protein